MVGKLIVIEGTDCSGKETQSNLLYKKLLENNFKVVKLSFPMYDSPTGKIVGGAYLGKKHIGECFFEEGAVNVEPKVAALYYAADRRYNLPKINKLLNDGYNVILDRYVYSNMAHQGCKITDIDERMNMYAWLDILEFKLLELPKADIAIFLHMPFLQTSIIKANRLEEPDQHESNEEHLRLAELAYIELASVYKWKTIECYDQGIKSVDAINEEVYDYVMKELNKSFE